MLYLSAPPRTSLSFFAQYRYCFGFQINVWQKIQFNLSVKESAWWIIKHPLPFSVRSYKWTISRYCDPVQDRFLHPLWCVTLFTLWILFKGSWVFAAPQTLHPVAALRCLSFVFGKCKVVFKPVGVSPVGKRSCNRSLILKSWPGKSNKTQSGHKAGSGGALHWDTCGV